MKVRYHYFVSKYFFQTTRNDLQKSIPTLSSADIFDGSIKGHTLVFRQAGRDT